MEKPITAVLIDTTAFHNRQCDFAGITSAMIPTFLRLLKSNHIEILSHPILDNEIRKHIKDSQIIERTRSLIKYVKKCKGVLASIGMSPEDILDRAEPEKIEKIFLEAYEAFYSDFLMLPYVEAQEVFADYFNTKPPFSATGDKKSEFPDAFVTKGLLQYCKNKPEAKVLVVSSDSDWKNTLMGNDQIELVNTLKDAMAFMWQQLGDKKEFVAQIWSAAIPKIMAEISNVAEQEAFSVNNIFELQDIEITKIHTTSMVGSMTPLEISKNSVLVHVSASLSVDGVAEYFDENRSQWDKEDQCYYYLAFTRMYFEDASAEIDCEVRLGFPSDGSMNPIEINDIRITNKWDICLDVSEAEIREEDITNYWEDDWYTEQNQALEEYHRH